MSDSLLRVNTYISRTCPKILSLRSIVELVFFENVRSLALGYVSIKVDSNLKAVSLSYWDTSNCSGEAFKIVKMESHTLSYVGAHGSLLLYS